MSMSTHVIGFHPPDDDWKIHKAVWDACEAAGVPIPDKTDEFFDGEPPDPAGVEIDIVTTEWSDEGREGYEVKVADIPPHVHTIRFYNSW